MNKRQLLILSMPTLLLSSCGKSVVVYLEPTFESYKSEATYENYTNANEESYNKCFVSNEETEYSFSLKLETGSKEIKTINRSKKEITKVTNTQIAKMNLLFDSNSGVGKAESVNEELVDGKQLDGSTTTTVNNYQKVTSEGYLQENAKDDKKYVATIDAEDKTYSNDYELTDDATIYKYVLSTALLVLVLNSSASGINYEKLSDEEKAKYHFYVDEDVFTETYSTSTKENIESSEKVVGNMVTTLDYKSQIIEKEDSIKINMVLNKKETSKYTADYNSYLLGDEQIVETNTYAQSEIKKDDINLGTFDLSKYALKE
ncbi:MAG TPA: hypothetical protein DDW20_05210 [Firmicutes bacterium]|nr:hypothetical protein [Bacillota bacterium]